MIPIPFAPCLTPHRTTGLEMEADPFKDPFGRVNKYWFRPSYPYSGLHIDSHPRDELHIKLRLNGHLGDHAGLFFPQK